MTGELFGRYELIDLLGRGGMGEVWRAHDTGTDRVVALKLLPTRFAEDPTFEQRFRREAHSAAQLSNPHIVPIHDYGDIDGRLYVDMALVEGHDLATEIATSPLSAERAVAITEQIARALAAAHRTGMVHRDVKPSNILIDHDDVAYLIDFGIARAEADPDITGAGATTGTWAYMAPERFTTDAIEPSSDIYALTCVLYESLTGTKPFPGDTLERQFAGHLKTPPPKPSAMRSELPAALDDVIAIGMAKDPQRRYRSAEDLAAAARDALSDPSLPETQTATQQRTAYQLAANPTEEPGAARPPQSSRRAAFLIGGAILLVAIVGAALLVISRDQTPAPTSQAAPTSQPAKSAPYGEQVTLPLSGLGYAEGVAVDSDGSVYVADSSNNRILRLDAGADTQSAVAFTGLNQPKAVAADNQGNVYVTDSYNNRVLKLAKGSTTPEELPFNLVGNEFAIGIGVGDSGAVFVTDSYSHRLLEWVPGMSAGHVVVEQQGLALPCDVAIDDAHIVYIANSGYNQILRLEPDGLVEMPFAGLSEPAGLAVDTQGNLYATDDLNRVIRLDVRTNVQTELPFTGLDEPNGVAVDSAGNVYVADSGNSRVLKLPVS